MSPIFYTGEDHESGIYHEHEFDPNADFAQFLEEARNHTTCEGEPKAATGQIEETGEMQSNGGDKRNRKSWKSSLFSWLIKNTDKKNKIPVEPFHGATTIPKLRRGGAFSGPIHGGSGLTAGSWSRKAISSGALLTSLFNPAPKRGEADGIRIPYVSLNHLNNPPLPDAQSYGPLYLVT